MGKLDPDNPKFDKPHFESITDTVAAINSSEKGPECYDKMFTESEIEAAIAEAQNHKATGLDKVPNEALTYGGQPIISAFHLLLNFMHNNSLSPPIWAKALVHLTYNGRSADPLDARSYRPISLTSCVSKVFERLLLNRVQDKLDDTETLPEEQAGFRPGRSTRDQTYILRKALDSRKAASKRTFLCFVDLSNAFPSAWQDGMWFRLREAGIKGKLFRSIRMLYRSCASAIQTPYGLTDRYTSDLGTRQGAVLSPFLFSLLISPLAQTLRAVGFGIPVCGTVDSRIACLLYADDLVLIADSEDEMRRLMTETSEFLKKWRFSVSAKKTSVVAFGPSETKGLKNRSWTLGGETVKDVRSYKYLGLLFQKDGSWTEMQDLSVEKTQGVYSQLYTIGFAEAGLQVGQSAFLWDLFANLICSTVPKFGH
jgi:hypothetical protein